MLLRLVPRIELNIRQGRIARFDASDVYGQTCDIHRQNGVRHVVYRKSVPQGSTVRHSDGSFKLTLRSKVRKQRRIRGAVTILRLIAVLASGAVSGSTQPGGTPHWTAKNPPEFEDFLAGETMHGTAASVKLLTRSERMFKTRLTKAAKEPPNFAGHYRVTYWGCGSNCSAAALVDLQSGEVFPPPLAKSNGSGWECWILCTACFEGSGDEFHVDSRLMIVRCGMNYSERLQRNVPDTYYFVWDYHRFRQILFVAGNQKGR